MSASVGSSRATKQRELWHPAAELGDNPFRSRWPDARERRKRFVILILDRGGHFAHWPHHCAQGLLHADAVDLAEQVEKFPFDGGQKADQPRSEPAVHRIALEIVDRVQTDFAAHLVLQLPPGELGNEHFVFERAHFEDYFILANVQQLARDFRNQTV